MAFTTNEANRARAQRYAREWRVTIGPRREQVTTGLFTAGSPVTLPSSTVTTAPVDDGDDTIPVNSTAGYPSEGDIAIRSDAGASWLHYTGTTGTSFSGVTWLHGADNHAGGATVEQWVDITDRVDGNPTIVETEDERFYDWHAELAGYFYRSDLMKDDATVLIEQRTTPDGVFGTWTDWTVAAVGYVREWTATGDATDRPWQARVESVLTYVRDHEIATRQYGDVDLAENATFTDGYSDGSSPANLGSPALADPNEFAQGLGTTEVANVGDGDPYSVYISAQAPTGGGETAGSGSAPLVIDELMLAGPGEPGLQYVVIRLAPYSVYYNASEPDKGLDLASRKWILTVTGQGAGYENSSHGATDFVDSYIRLPRVTLTPNNPTVVLCYNREIFERFFGTSGQAAVYDWRYSTRYNNISAGLPADGLQLDPAGGALHLREINYAVWPSIQDMVAWGSPSDFFLSNDDSPGEWDDPNTVTLGRGGTSIRRTPYAKDNNLASDWAVEEHPLPDDAGGGDSVWLDADLGQFSRTIDSTKHPSGITASSPGAGEKLYIEEDARVFDAAGTLRIDSEDIDYASRGDDHVVVAARAANGTTAASHTTSAEIYAVHDFGSGPTAHRLYAVSAVDLVRRFVPAETPIAGTRVYPPVVPARVEIWATRQGSPRHPGDSVYYVDWIGQQPMLTATNQGSIAGFPALTFNLSLSPDSRDTHFRHLMMVIRGMSDGGRVKLNEVNIWRRQPADNVPETDLAGAGAILYDLLREVLTDAEIDIAADAFAGTSLDRTVPAGSLRRALDTILAETLTTMRATLDGRVEVRKAPEHPRGPRPEITVEIDADMIYSGHEATYPSRVGADALRLTIIHPGTKETFSVQYPPNGTPGKVQEEELRLEVSQSDAYGVAQALWLKQPARSRRFSFATAGPAEGLRSGQRVLFRNQSDESEENELIQCRIVEVQHGGERNNEQGQLVEWIVP